MTTYDMTPMSKRTTIVLPDKVFEDLERWADEEGRPTANLAAFLVEQSVRLKYPSDYPSAFKARWLRRSTSSYDSRSREFFAQWRLFVAIHEWCDPRWQFPVVVEFGRTVPLRYKQSWLSSGSLPVRFRMTSGPLPDSFRWWIYENEYSTTMQVCILELYCIYCL